MRKKGNDILEKNSENKYAIENGDWEPSSFKDLMGLYNLLFLPFGRDENLKAIFFLITLNHLLCVKEWKYL